MKINSLKNLIEIRTGEVISTRLMNDENIDISLFGFYKGESISFEKSNFDRLYIPVENSLNMRIKCNENEQSYTINPYDFTFIPKNIYREISGKENYKLIMCTIKRRNTMLKNIEKQKLLKLEEEIEYQENKIASKTLVSNEKLAMTLFAFKGKQELSTHTAPGDAFVIALDGEAKITIDGKDFQIKQGESIIMPANIPHAVAVETNYKMLLILSK